MLPDPAGQNPGTLNQPNALLSSLDSPFPCGSGTATLASRISSQKSHREWKAEKKRVELERSRYCRGIGYFTWVVPWLLFLKTADL